MISTRTRMLRALACFLAFTGIGLVGLRTGSAQVAIPAEAVSSMADVQRVLQLGEQFEHQQRWGDALLHYEEAVKSHPESPLLVQRLTLARIHYDLTRRYHDSSFLDSLRTMTPPVALDVYGEVLLKIQSHYVTDPNWQELVRLGATHLDVALGQPLFIEQQVPKATSQQITAFRSELSRLLNAMPVRDRHTARQLVYQVAQAAQRKLELSPTAVILEFTSGATSALDMYSAFLTPAQLDDLFSQIEGNFVGLGIELKLEESSLLVVDVIGGGPAEAAGMRPGDRIVGVNGQATAAMAPEAAADMLKGPEGSEVRVTVRGADGLERSLQVPRRRVEVPSVVGVRLIDPQLGVGYLKMSSFQKTTSRDVDAALWKLYRQGMRSLIVDVRGNPGGLLNSAVEIADKFVADGTLVSTRGRGQREDFDYAAHRVGTWRVPLVVLIDGESASASEIFAAAIHDHGRGTVVGQRSYGKGSVQGVFPLTSSRAGVRLTTAKFFSPTGRPISLQGVQPHIAVQVAAKPALDGTPDGGTGDGGTGEPAQDAALESALRVARQQVARK